MSQDPFSSFNFPSTIYQFLIVPFSEARVKKEMNFQGGGKGIQDLG